MSHLALYVSLGHNASAVLCHDGAVVRGYEQERMDRKKSSSAYPREAIEAAMGVWDAVDDVYVSHWFDDMTLAANKYLDIDHLQSIAGKVTGLSEDFTHHDAHAMSAINFADSHPNSYSDANVIVCDGFGSFQECFSVYRHHRGQSGVLLHRTYGYKMSLGLCYQYATEYLGLKPNQDEYKLLGYETDILKYASPDKLSDTIVYVDNAAKKHVERMLLSTERPRWNGDLFDKAALQEARSYWREVAAIWRALFHDVVTPAGVRTCVAYCTQRFVESCVLRLINRTIEPRASDRTLILAGGVFYNVKLNRQVQVSSQLRTICHPLAGDQGAALGHTPGLKCSGLLWGERSIRRGHLPAGVIVAWPDTWATVAAEHIYRERVVNVVRGAMEYGPRALCNTTTFALPTKESVSRINALNERDESMPMAPVMTVDAAIAFLRKDELQNCGPSLNYMITTCAFRERPGENMMGVAHKDPLLPVWTARPQVTDDTEVCSLLRAVPNETLINTSFNYHGEPIVASDDDACRTHSMQCFRAKTLGIDEPVTILVQS
jgi:carbamoyltransferase